MWREGRPNGTMDAGDQVGPTWSGDGQIYFMWRRGRDNDIWRTGEPRPAT